LQSIRFKRFFAASVQSTVDFLRPAYSTPIGQTLPLRNRDDSGR
jgi:hypothetical protein